MDDGDKLRQIKLGVLMDSLICDPYLFELITNLAKDPNIELYLLQNNPKCRENRFKRVANVMRDIGLFRFIDSIFFGFIIFIERKIMSLTTHTDLSNECRLDFEIFEKTILLTPVLSKTKVSKRNLLVSYGDVDIKKIQSLGLDLILRGNGGGVFQGKILGASRGGFLSFHHGDNRWNRGVPAGFWEVYLKKPATGFIIQILNERLDDGDVIFRGEAPTHSVYTLNLRNILQEGNPYMEQIIKGYAETGTLPPPLQKKPYSNTLLKSPKCTETLAYAARTTILLTSIVFKSKVLRLKDRWSVAFIRSDWKDSNLSKATVVKNPKGRFLADPFVAICGNQTVMFVEDYHYSTRRGAISAVRISPDGSYEILPDIISEDFHLSFPYIFKYGDTLYMVPESYYANSIRLYKCVTFPDHWEYMYDIMRGVNAFDTMVFEHSGRWWLLTTIAPIGSREQMTQLYLFSASEPLSQDWQPHPKNPVCISLDFKRNGGLLRDVDGTIFRVRQKQGFNRYGSMISIARITRLDMECYEETTYCEVEPKFFPDLVGTHHMHSAGGITVFDFVKEETIK